MPARLSGLDRAVELLKGKAAGERIDIRDATAAESRTRPGSYLSKYSRRIWPVLRGPLRELGVISDHDEAVWPDITLTNHAGGPVADALDIQDGFAQLAEAARDGSATVGELVTIGAAVHPKSIEPELEQSLLRGLLLGTDEELCRTQRPEQRHQRRISLRLMLDFLVRSDVLNARPDAEFRWACAVAALPSGAVWTTPPDLAAARTCWGTYQRNDILNFALECLFWAVLVKLDDTPWSPFGLARHIADAAAASLATSAVVLRPLATQSTTGFTSANAHPRNSSTTRGATRARGDGLISWSLRARSRTGPPYAAWRRGYSAAYSGSRRRFGTSLRRHPRCFGDGEQSRSSPSTLVVPSATSA